MFGISICISFLAADELRANASRCSEPAKNKICFSDARHHLLTWYDALLDELRMWTSHHELHFERCKKMEDQRSSRTSIMSWAAEED
ncbi:hypothetical protein M5D96_007894 [Drosophila gunungcola]|uniref:Uncharacterized protein n=1 Tax=Drosophila gunungcola TaxID=103775 RepID=A0A9P9YLF9_9MUSC|nr:hypothetical protein M5D96_007894 [Drosophila gunungcola]